MTPNEKTLSLLSKHRTIIRKADKYEHNLSSDEIYLSKESAIVSCNELIQECFEDGLSDRYKYWKNVKSELEKL